VALLKFQIYHRLYIHGLCGDLDQLLAQEVYIETAEK
jgi:hypothetical protein